MSSPAPEKSPFVTGTRVITDKGLQGAVAFFGTTEFSEGKWVGVILDEAKGKNNGTVQGKQYFTCDDNHGIFMRPAQVKSATDSNIPKSGLRPPQQVRKGSATKASSSRGGTASPKMSPSPSMEKLKAPRTGMRTSPSSEKLKQSPSSDRIKQSPEKKSPRPSPSQSTEDLKSKVPKPATTAPPREAVSHKIAQIQQASMDRAGGDDGILVKVPKDMSDSAELEYLRSEVKDVHEKLETLRAKRAEDKQKLTDYERCKIQLQQLLEFKNKMTDQHAELQRQLQEARKEAKEAMESKDAYTDEMSGIAEAAEMAALDKEMAEEKADLLVQELETCKERIKELEMDLEIIKGEMEGVGADSSGVDDGIKVKQLEQQNERLKEALVKMRDISGHSGQETQRLLKETEVMKVQISELSKKNDKLTLENNQYEIQMADLKEHVDAALGSEEMVEQLTSRNLTLEERVRELEETIDDFEQMKMIDEEVQENARDTERELRQELDLAGARANELNMRLQQAAEKMKDYELTISKFRQRTAQLQEEIQDLKDQVLRAEARGETTSETEETEEPRTVGSLAQTRSFVELVDSEHKRIELDSAQQHVKYLKAFLPDNFGKAGGDGDAMLINLFFPRLASKTASLCKQLIERYPSVPGGMRREHVVKSHKAEQWGFCARFTYLLNAMTSVVRKFDGAMSRCSVERLSRLAQLQPEMLAQERQMESYFELLKTNRLDENTSLAVVEKVINYFQNIYSVHLATDEYDGSQFMSDSIQQLLSGTRWFRISLERLGFYLLPTDDNSELCVLLKEFKVSVDDCEQHLVRCKNRMPKADSGNVIKLPPEALELLSDTAGNLHKAANLLHEACSAASTQVSMLPDVEGLEFGRLNEMLQEASEKVNGKGQEKWSQTVIKPSLSVVVSNTRQIADSLDDCSWQVAAPTQPFPALLERAHLRKQDALEADSLRWQVEKKENELMEMKKLCRVRTEEISQLKVRVDMAEKRLQSSGKDGDEKALRLQRRVDDLQSDLKKKDREYEQTMDTLQSELEALEKENSDLKDRIKMLSKKALLQGISREAGVTTPTREMSATLPIGAQDSPLLLQQIDSLSEALNVSEHARWSAEGDRLRRAMASLRPLNVPRRPAGLHTQGALMDLDAASSKRHDELAGMLRESNRLVKEFVDFTAHNRVIDITKIKPGTPPVIEKKTPEFELSQQMKKAKQLDYWMKDLNARMQQYRASQLPAWKADTDFGHFPKASFKQTHERRGFVAKISLPCSEPKDAGRTIPVTMSQEQFRKIHQRLIAN